MRSLFTIILSLLLFAAGAQAKNGGGKVELKKEHEHHHDNGKHDHKDTQTTAKKIAADKMVLKVRGMVCAFCAQGIEKNFNAKPEVKSTKVDLDKMEVLITLKEGKSLTPEEIKAVVEGAGFAFVGVVE